MKRRNQYLVILGLWLLAAWALLLLFGMSPASADSGVASDASRILYTGRTMGMGGAHVALSDDGEGLFSNPSGLTQIEYPQLMGMTKRILLGETAYTIWGWAFPTPVGVIGFGYAGALISDSLPTMRDPGTSRIVINPSREAMSYENGVTIVSFATKIPWHDLSLGGNLKLFNQSIRTTQQLDQANGFGLDLSAFYKANHYLKLGMNIQNLLTSGINWTNSAEKLGGLTKFGAALNLLGNITGEALYFYRQDLIACADVDLPHDTLSSPPLLHMGMEWYINKDLAIRAGLNQRSDSIGPTFGVGLRNSAFRFDYAYAETPGLIGDNANYFSLAYVGDRIFSVKEKFKRYDPDIRFLSPGDRSITNQEMLPIRVEPRGKMVFDRRKTWTVPLIETTYEVEEDSRSSFLFGVKQNNYPISRSGTYEILTLLDLGRNTINVSGSSAAEGVLLSGECHILRITPFADVPMDYWALEPISLDSALGMMSGYPNNTFRPEKGITRAEMTVLLVKAAGVAADRIEEARNETKFIDLKGKWYQPYINVGVDIGLITGYPDRSFNPEKVLNRTEGIVLVARFARIPGKEGSGFPDIKPGYWANKVIQGAKDTGLLKYLEGKDFEPEHYFSRSEAAEVLYRTDIIQRKANDFWEYGLNNEP